MTSNSATGAPIRILQLTDFHLLADPTHKMMGVNTEDTFIATLDAASKQNSAPDLLLLTGDLVQEAGADTYLRLRRHLERLDIPSFCLPGNHDDWSLMRGILAAGKVSCEPGGAFGAWQVICLDSTVPDNPGGFLDRSQLELLESLLADQPEKFALVSLHHSPLPTGSGWLDTMRLANAEAFFSLLGRYPKVRGVVCGHVHQEFDQMQGNIRVMACPSTCFQFKPHSEQFALDSLPSGYRWLDLYPNGVIGTGVERLLQAPAGLDLTSEGY